MVYHYGRSHILYVPVRVSKLLSNPPRSRVRNGQLSIGGRFGGEQPHLFSQLDSVLLVSVAAAGALESAGKLDLYRTVSVEMMILQSANIGVGG